MRANRLLHAPCGGKWRERRGWKSGSEDANRRMGESGREEVKEMSWLALVRICSSSRGPLLIYSVGPAEEVG